MSSAPSSSSSVVPTSTRTTPPLEFGPTHVVMPKDQHLATIVWLHGLDDNGYDCSRVMGSLPVNNVKWICPTAPTRPTPIFARLPGAAWFDPRDISEESSSSEVDKEGLDATAEHVYKIFSTEPHDVKLAVGGFSIGATAALYTVTHYTLSENFETFDRALSLGNLTAVVVLSGWLPLYMSMWRKMAESSLCSVLRVKGLHVYICHGVEDDVVNIEHGERSAHVLHSCGFKNLQWRKFEGLGHDTSAEEVLSVCYWLADALELQRY